MKASRRVSKCLPPSTTSTSTNNNDDSTANKTQMAIIAGLLKQQPVIEPVVGSQALSAAISGTGMVAADLSTLMKMEQLAGVDIHSILNMIHSLSQQNTTISAKSNSNSNSNSKSKKSEIKLEFKDAATSESKRSETEYKGRTVREKVCVDGYIMSFDKYSTCGQKEFWRCERKHECTARLHSYLHTREVMKSMNPHNHARPPPEELAFYHDDYSGMLPNMMYRVRSISRAYVQKQLNAGHTVSTAPLPREIDISPPPSPQLMIQAAPAAEVSPSAVAKPQIARKRSFSKANPEMAVGMQPRALKMKPSDNLWMLNHPEFRETLELAKEITRLMKPKHEVKVRWDGDQESLLIFVSHDNGDAEHVFHPVVVEKRDEKSLCTALETFTGKKCAGNLVLTYSKSTKIMVHEALIARWTHGKLLLINSDNPALWHLTPVDAYGRAVSSL